MNPTSRSSFLSPVLLAIVALVTPAVKMTARLGQGQRQGRVSRDQPV